MPILSEVALKGDKIYKERYQRDYELKYHGKFLAIDVTSEDGKAFLADSPEAALKTAEKDNPKGFFYLLRIGAPGVYRVGYTQGKPSGWQL